MSEPSTHRGGSLWQLSEHVYFDRFDGSTGWSGWVLRIGGFYLDQLRAAGTEDDRWSMGLSFQFGKWGY